MDARHASEGCFSNGHAVQKDAVAKVRRKPLNDALNSSKQLYVALTNNMGKVQTSMVCFPFDKE